MGSDSVIEGQGEEEEEGRALQKPSPVLNGKRLGE